VRSCVEVDRRRKLKYAQGVQTRTPSGQQYMQHNWQQHEQQYGGQVQVAEAEAVTSDSYKEVDTKTESTAYAHPPEGVPELQATRDPRDPVEAYADPVFRHEMPANEPWMTHESS
jgi:hypothetical protein